MTEWGVVGVIAALVALGAAIVTPLIKLTKAITALTINVSAMQKTIEGQKADNKASHDRLWRRSDEHDAKLSDHETRIGIIEQMERMDK